MWVSHHHVQNYSTTYKNIIHKKKRQTFYCTKPARASSEGPVTWLIYCKHELRFYADNSTSTSSHVCTQFKDLHTYVETFCMAFCHVVTVKENSSYTFYQHSKHILTRTHHLSIWTRTSLCGGYSVREFSFNADTQNTLRVGGGVFNAIGGKNDNVCTHAQPHIITHIPQNDWNARIFCSCTAPKLVARNYHCVKLCTSVVVCNSCAKRHECNSNALWTRVSGLVCERMNGMGGIIYIIDLLFAFWSQ